MGYFENQAERSREEITETGYTIIPKLFELEKLK